MQDNRLPKPLLVFFTLQPPWNLLCILDLFPRKTYLSVPLHIQIKHAHISTNTYYTCTHARFCSPRTQVKQDSLLYRFFPDREFFCLRLNSQVTVEINFLNIPHTVTCGNTCKTYHVTTWECRLNKKIISPHIMGAVTYTQKLPLPKAT